MTVDYDDAEGEMMSKWKVRIGYKKDRAIHAGIGDPREQFEEFVVEAADVRGAAIAAATLIWKSDEHAFLWPGAPAGMIVRFESILPSFLDAMDEVAASMPTQRGVALEAGAKGDIISFRPIR